MEKTEIINDRSSDSKNNLGNNEYIFYNSFVDIDERRKDSLGSLLKRDNIGSDYIQPRHINAEVVPYQKIEL